MQLARSFNGGYSIDSDRVFSGTAWFVAWLLELSVAKLLIDVHKTLVPLVGIYILGHGGMALTHFVIWQRKTRRAREQRP